MLDVTPKKHVFYNCHVSIYLREDNEQIGNANQPNVFRSYQKFTRELDI